MLFIGAGMSKVFGIKTMPELYVEVKRRIERKGSELSEMISSIEELLSRYYPRRHIDIEAVFSVLNGCLKPGDAVLDAGPFAAYLVAHLSTKALVADKDFLPPPLQKPESELKELITLAQIVIAEECRKIDFQKMKDIYNKLFAVVPFGKARAVTHPNPQTPTQQTSSMISNIIATTNYDLAIESYFRNLKTGIVNGFVDSGYDQQYHFAHGHVLRGEMILNLIKLHGSINWFVMEDGEIVQRADEPSGDYFYGEQKIIGKMMIYPMQEKYVSRDPYATLFNAFRRELFNSDVHICIGYSFRDQAINNAFSDAAKLNPRFLLFIINPEAEEISNRLDISKDKCIRISYRIDQPESLTLLGQYLAR